MKMRRVLVVGAGLAGTLIARKLLDQGIEVDLVERRSSFSPQDGAGLMLTPNGIKALINLGFTEIKTLSKKIELVRFKDHSGNRLGEIDCRLLSSLPFCGIRYSVVREVLVGDLDVQHGVSVKNIAPGSRPWVHLSNGKAQRYDLVVGADGIMSTVRGLLFGPDFLTALDGYSGFRFVVSNSQSKSQAGIFLGNGLTFLLIPIGRDEVYCAAGPISGESRQEGSSFFETVRRSFEEFGDDVRFILDSVDEPMTCIPTKYGYVNLPKWSKGPCVLVGDAAHAMPPTLSQGASMAFEDVDVLLNCLAENETLERAIADYEKRRRSRIEYVQAHSIQRMSANQRVEARTHEARLMASAAFGIKQLGSIWANLTNNST